MKNKIFFLLYLFFNPRLLMPLMKGVYLPVYVQYEWLKKYKINVAIDVGAYHGHVSHAIRYIFPKALIYAFEPVEENCKKIERKLGSKNVILIRCALGKKNGISNFYQYSNPSLSSLLLLNKNIFTSDNHINTAKAKVITLDTYFEKKRIRGNVFFKIDTQGSELSILQGGENFLKYISIIHIETSFREIYSGQALFAEVYSYLTKHGFTYFGEVQEAHFYPPFKTKKQANSIFVNTKKINMIF